jgi:hypothetical protein
LIQIQRADVGMVEAAEIALAGLVAEEDDDVGARGRSGRGGRGSREGEKEG